MPYIVLEGPDGGGKTTQKTLLERSFAAAGLPHLFTREPGGTPVGDAIRKVLLEGDVNKMDALTEIMLFSAQRHELVRQVVQPALERGTWVVSDRCFLSTYVFQGYGGGQNKQLIMQLTEIALGTFFPDLILILDVPPEVSLSRKVSQAQATGLTEMRMEEKGDAYHARNYQGYHDYAAANPQTTTLIQAGGTPAEVHARIIQTLNTRYSLNLPLSA
jgi:dTMP kinase